MVKIIAAFRRSWFLALVAAAAVLAGSLPVSSDTLPEPVVRTFDGETYLVEPNQRLLDLPHPSVAVAIGGGGARALVNIGVLKALEEEAIPVDLLVGTSMGAIIAVLYGSGMPLAEIERLVIEADLPGMFSVAFPFHRSVLNTVELNHFVEQAIPVASLEEFPVRTALLSFDLTDGQKYLHTAGPVSTAMQGPYAIPLFFRGQKLGRHFLVDAGIQELTPSKAARALGADLVIGVTSFDQLPYSTYDSPIRSWVRLINLIKEHESLAALDRTADVVIVHEVGDYSFMDFDLAKHFIELGYRRAKESIPAIKAALQEKGIAPRPPAVRRATGVGRLLSDLDHDRLELDHTNVTPVFHFGKDYSTFKQSLFREDLRTPQYGVALNSGKLKAQVVAQGAGESVEAQVRMVKVTPATDLVTRIRRDAGGQVDAEAGLSAYWGRLWGELGLADRSSTDRYLHLKTAWRAKQKTPGAGLTGGFEADFLAPLQAERQVRAERQAEHVVSGMLRLPFRPRQAVELRAVAARAEVLPIPRIYRGAAEAEAPQLQASLEFTWQHPFAHSLELAQILRLSEVDFGLFCDVQSLEQTGERAQALGAKIRADLSLLGLRPAVLGLNAAYDLKRRETVSRLEVDVSF